MTALVALALAAAPGCPEALAAVARLGAPGDLGLAAPGIAARLEERGPGGPAGAISHEAEAFAEAVRSGEADLEALAGRFRARLARHCALAAERPAAAALRPGDRRALDEILARPEFREARADPGLLGRWLAGLWRRILDLLGTEEAGRYAAGGRTAFFAAVALAAAAGLAWAVRRRRLARDGPAQPVAAAATAPETRQGPDDGTLDPGGSTARRSFLSLLEKLERQGRIPRGRALTNRELASHLAAANGLPAGLASSFAELADRFDRLVYGGAPLHGAELLAFLHRLGSLHTLAEADS